MNDREFAIIFGKLETDAGDIEAIAEEKAATAEAHINRMLDRVEKQIAHMESNLEKIRSEFNSEVSWMRQHFAHEIPKTRSATKRFRSHIGSVNYMIGKAVAEKDKEIAKLQKQIEELKLAGPTQQLELDVPKTDPRAATLAIYDSIIFAIGNWSTEGDTAPDFELACQSILFPVVYERVMKGEDDYYIEEVPCSAMEVVKRGREYVKMLRATCEGSLVAPDVWNEHACMIQEWWVRDALPMLYGARADEWDEDKPLSLMEVLEWRDQPASRALHFPLIFDGMELVEKNRDLIRESTGLPAFNKTTLETRLTP